MICASLLVSNTEPDSATISDLGYADFSDWFIGHSGSTYWTKRDSEKAEIFRKIEPYLTFLNIPQLERQGADTQTKIEELEALNQAIMNRDKLKDDTIAHLSDQLIALTSRLDSIEKRQEIQLESFMATSQYKGKSKIPHLKSPEK